jgi:tight adherence protein B
MVATESEGPVAVEIRKTFVEVSFGMSWDRALENLAKRVPLAEVALFVAALQIHSRTGGRLGDIMNRLAEGMREQNSLEGEIRSIAAHGKLTGFILTLVPVGIVVIMMIVSPDYIQVLLTHPYGKHMIAAAIVCLCLAHFIIQRLVDIEI